MKKYLKTMALTTKLISLLVPLTFAKGDIFEGYKREAVRTINELIEYLGDDVRYELIRRLAKRGLLIDACLMGVKLF